MKIFEIKNNFVFCEKRLKITLDTIKEIVVFTTYKTTVDEITKIEAIDSNPKLFWCNGLLFNYSRSDNAETTKQLLSGIFYIDTFTYAISDKIDQSAWNCYKVEVVDMTGHFALNQLTKSLKENNID